jgi:hypothetical protein
VIRETSDSVTLKVKVKPKARSNAIAGVRGDALRVHVTAAPTDGEANRAVIKVLSDALNVPRSQIEIVTGHTSREKVVKIAGVKAADVMRISRGWN